MNLKEMGRKIKEQRNYKGMTQEQLSEAVNITPAYLSGIERGNKIASIKIMLAIANALEMSLDFMLLDDIEKLEDKNMIDANMHEFEFMLNEIEDKALINEFIAYCRAISKEMVNKKNEKVG